MKLNLILPAVVASFMTLVGSTITRAGVADSAEEAKPLGTGNPVPDVTVKTAEGKDFALKKEIEGKPTVLIFYRGGWCPFCNRHLSELEKSRQELLYLGYQILAICADPPEDLQPAAEKQELSYTLLSDVDMNASGAFGLAFYLDDATVEKYKDYGIKLTAKHDGRFWLPVPAVYIVDKAGQITFAHTDPDYRKRLAMPALLEAAREAAK